MLLRLVVLALAAVANARDAYYDRNGYEQDYNGYNNQGRSNYSNLSRPSVFCYINGTRLLQQQNYGGPRYGSDMINPSLCTHIVYGAANLDRHSANIKLINEGPGQVHGGSLIPIEELVALKAQKGRNSDLKIFISVSGSTEDWSNIAKLSRHAFANNVKNFLRSNHLDGVNIDWQYPTRQGGSVTSDKINFHELLKDLKQALRMEGCALSVSLPPLKESILEGYDINDSMEVVDYWLLMAFEFFGTSYSTTIGANAPINGRRGRMNVERSVSEAAEMFRGYTYKLVLVIPFYGRRYHLEKLLGTGDSPIEKKFTDRHAPTEQTLVTYRDACKEFNRGWTRGWDDDAQVPFLVKEKQVIVYDDDRSVQKKTELALKYRLGGVMAFSIDMDDYDGSCGNNGNGFGSNGGRTYDNGYDRQNSYGNPSTGNNYYNNNNNNNRDNRNYNNNNQGSNYYNNRDNSYNYNRDSNRGYNNNDYYTRGRYPLLQAMYETAARGSSSTLSLSSPLALLLTVVVALTYNS